MSPPVRLALACFTSGDRDPEHTAGSSPSETFIKLVPRTSSAPTTASGKSQHADGLDSGSPSATARSIIVIADCWYTRRALLCRLWPLIPSEAACHQHGFRV